MRYDINPSSRRDISRHVAYHVSKKHIANPARDLYRYSLAAKPLKYNLYPNLIHKLFGGHIWAAVKSAEAIELVYGAVDIIYPLIASERG